jgi:hypothetical protein
LEFNISRSRTFDITPASAELEALMVHLPAIKAIFTTESKKNHEAMSALASGVQESWTHLDDNMDKYCILVWTGKEHVLDCCNNTWGLIAKSLPDLVQVEEVGDSYNIYLTRNIYQKDWEFALEQMFEHWNSAKKVKLEKEFLQEMLAP